MFVAAAEGDGDMVNGRGDAFGQHGSGKHRIGPEQMAQGQGRYNAPQTADGASHQDGQEILLEHLPLLINIQGQHRRGRSQQHGDDGSPRIEMFQRDTSDRQDHHDHQGRSQHRVAQQPAGFFLEFDPQHPADEDQSQTKEWGPGKSIKHGQFLSFSTASGRAGRSSR